MRQYRASILPPLLRRPTGHAAYSCAAVLDFVTHATGLAMGYDDCIGCKFLKPALASAGASCRWAPAPSGNAVDQPAARRLCDGRTVGRGLRSAPVFSDSLAKALIRQSCWR